jgi:hypothetical protein
MFIATENLTAERFRPGAWGTSKSSPVKGLGQWYFFGKVNAQTVFIWTPDSGRFLGMASPKTEIQIIDFGWL